MRKSITKREISRALGCVGIKLRQRLKEKGDKGFVSRHEVLGVIEEEMHELKDACRESLLAHFEHELLDMAVASILGLICLQGDHLEW